MLAERLKQMSLGNARDSYVLFSFQTDKLFIGLVGLFALVFNNSILAKDLLLQVRVLIIRFSKSEASGFKFVLEIGRGSGSSGRRRRDPVVRRLAVFEP